MTHAADMFADLEDESVFSGSSAPVEAGRSFSVGGIAAGVDAEQMPRTPFRETCAKCRGTGSFRSWSGNYAGQCFSCKGKGFREYATERHVRVANRDKAHARKQASAEAWISEHKAVMDWARAKAPRFNFAAQMCEAVQKYGHLTDGQLATCERLMKADAERDAARAAERAAIAESAPTIDTTRMEAAFQAAREAGIKFPKMRLGFATLSLAPASGVNAGAVYVKSDGEYLGKIKDGKFQRSFKCEPAVAEEIVKAAADPLAAAVAYGRRTGNCAICARELTNGESIERGIGPICAEKWGL